MTHLEALQQHLNRYSEGNNRFAAIPVKGLNFNAETALLAVDPDKNGRLIDQASVMYRQMMMKANLSSEQDIADKVGEFTSLPIDETSRMAKIETLKYFAGQMDPGVTITIPINPQIASLPFPGFEK